MICGNWLSAHLKQVSWLTIIMYETCLLICAPLMLELTKESSGLSRHIQDEISAEENQAAQDFERDITQKVHAYKCPCIVAIASLFTDREIFC